MDSVLKSNNNLFDIFIFNVPQTLTNEAELINKIDKINIFTRLNKDSISELSKTLGNLEKLNFSERQKITEIIINDYDSQDQWQKSLLAFVEEYYPNLITEKISKKTGDFNQELFFERLAKKLENQLELLV